MGLASQYLPPGHIPVARRLPAERLGSSLLPSLLGFLGIKLGSPDLHGKHFYPLSISLTSHPESPPPPWKTTFQTITWSLCGEAELPLGSPSFGQHLKGLETNTRTFSICVPGACGLTAELWSSPVPAALDLLVQHSGTGLCNGLGCAPQEPGLW